MTNIEAYFWIFMLTTNPQIVKDRIMNDTSWLIFQEADLVTEKWN